MNRWSIANCIVFLVAATTIHAINLTGTVTGSSGNNVRGAIVSLVNNDLKDTTDRNGRFTLFDGVVDIVPRDIIPSVKAFTMEKSIVQFNMPQQTPVIIDLFDMQGNLLRPILNQTLPAGKYRYDIATDPLATRMIAVRVQAGQQGTIFRYLPMSNGYTAGSFRNRTTAGGISGLAKISSSVDSLLVEADGYESKTIILDTLFGEVNVTLDSVIPDLANFSFFVTSLKALRELSGSNNGFGGDLRFGHTGPGAGLRGADSICECIAERSLPGSKVKQWRAFLSITADENGQQVDAVDRIGNGPWYDRLGRLLAPDLDDLINARPQNGDPAIRNDLPNEDGVPNHQPDPNLPAVDNHHFLTGSDTEGRLYGDTFTCEDWTSTERSAGRPRIGFSWPASRRENWISGQTEGGCGAGVNLAQNGGSDPNNPIVGSGGGYGGFYCFALNP